MKFGNLGKYITEHCYSPITKGSVFEGIRNTDIEKALKAISGFLYKRKVYTIPAIEAATEDGETIFMVYAWTQSNKGCAFCWRRGDTSTINSICFTNDFDKTYAAFLQGIDVNWDVEIALKGASIVRAIQLVADVLNGRVGMDKVALNKVVRDAQIWESVEDMEGLDGIIIEKKGDDAVMDELKRKKDNLYMKIRQREKRGHDVSDLQAEYDKLKAEYDEARVSIRKDVKMSPIQDPTEKRIEDRFEEEQRALPEERFSDMNAYVNNVLNGVDPCALICGAPGVGKTYRIMQNLRKRNMQLGVDYEMIKGKCTPLSLYATLHDFQKKGQIVIIDDADDIIQDMTSINLIKAATDSSDERVVSYGSSATPLVPEGMETEFDDWETDGKGKLRYPRRFEFCGGIIIITNMQAGGIDTAIRSRAMICDLNFTTTEVLDLIRGLAPHIAPETLTPQSKELALAYLQKLADEGAPMEISIRTFTLLCKLYLSDAPTEAIERRIREQMKLKFTRTKGRY